MGSKVGNDNEEMYSKVKDFTSKNNLDSTVQVKKDARGIILELKENILFDSGQADIKSSSKEILDKISELIKSIPKWSGN